MCLTKSGAASLCTRAVSSWPEAAEALAEFERGTDPADQWGEFFHDNELIAETFFEGRELSFEILRQGGRTVLAVEHEGALHLTDILHRRTMIGLEPGFGRAVQEEVAALLGSLPLDAAGLADLLRAAVPVPGALSMPWVPRLR